MNSYELSRGWFDFSFNNPELISPNHTAIYFFAIEHCNRLGWKEKFGFPTQMAMDALGIKKHQTYIRYFNDLVDWGFFKLIQKSTNQYSSNIISINCAMPKNGKALDKAIINHTAKQTEPIGQSNSSIDKQYNKITTNHISDSKEPDLNSNKVVKKKKEKEPHKSYNHIKEKFLKHYSEAGPGTPYYFEAKDGNKINRIIAKLKTLVKAKNPNMTEDNEPDAINRSFDYILANMNDKFVNENLSLSMIDSKFNEIVAKVKKGKVEEKEVKSIKFRI